MKNDRSSKITKIIIALPLALALIVFASCMPDCGLYLSTLDWASAYIQKYYYEPVDPDDVRAAGLENLSGNVLDIYSRYYTAEEYRSTQASNSGSRSGIGVSYQLIPDGAAEGLEGGVYVASVSGNSPASRAGLRAGERIISCACGGEEYAVEDTADFSAFVSARKTGESFTVLTDHGSYTLAREDYTMSYAFMATADAVYNVVYGSDGRQTEREESDAYAFLPEGTAYMALSQFYGNAPDEIAELFSVYNSLGCERLIFDLRNNGGGYVSAMQQIGSLFVKNYPQSGHTLAGYAEYKPSSGLGREDFAIESVPDSSLAADGECYLPAGSSVTVLANNGTASASEALIGVLVSYGIADYSDIWVSDLSEGYLDYTGTAEKNCRTYGKGIMQSTFVYYTGEALKLTVAKIYWPNGVCIHDRGIGEEQGCNVAPAEWTYTYADEELQFVVSQLSAQV